MKKIIYAKTLNPECFDYMEYDIEQDSCNKIVIDGGKHFKSIDTNDYLKDIKNFIKNGQYNEYEENISITELISAYLPKKENGKNYSTKEKHLIQQELKQGIEIDITLVCLSIITNSKYKAKWLYGSCQGNLVLCYYPDYTYCEFLDYVEAIYFGTGTETIIHDEENAPKNADDISGFSFVSVAYNDNELIKDIKRNAGYKEDDEDVEVVLYKYTDTKIIKEDVYEKQIY